MTNPIIPDGTIRKLSQAENSITDLVYSTGIKQGTEKYFQDENNDIDFNEAIDNTIELLQSCKIE